MLFNLWYFQWRSYQQTKYCGCLPIFFNNKKHTIFFEFWEKKDYLLVISYFCLPIFLRHATPLDILENKVDFRNYSNIFDKVNYLRLGCKHTFTSFNFIFSKMNNFSSKKLYPPPKINRFLRFSLKIKNLPKGIRISKK